MKTNVIQKLAISLILFIVTFFTISCGNSGDGQTSIPNSETAETAATNIDEGQTSVPNSDTTETAPVTPDITCSEIGEGWIAYDGKEMGIRFCYPSEWGEVIDYADYFKKELLADWESEELSKEVLEYRKWRDEAFESAANSGQYLCFSNLDMEWGAHIRITSVEKIQSFLSNASKSFASPEAVPEHNAVWLVPLFGYFGGQFAVHPDYREQLPQMIRDIADLPEGASPEDLQDTALPVFFLFANGLRYMDLRSDDEVGTVIGVLRTTYGQIATIDGKLSGVTEIGSEGWDVASRDYWNCILTTSDGNRLVYVAFSLQLPHYGAWDSPVEWSMGETPPGFEELLEEQQNQFIKFTRTITLLK